MSLVIGLTGSIGMGKSTASQLLKRLGLPVYDADAAIHSLMRAGGAAIQPIRKISPKLSTKALWTEPRSARAFSRTGRR